MRQIDHIHICSTSLSTCERLSALFRIEHCQTSFSRNATEWADLTDGQLAPSLLVVATDFGAVLGGLRPLIAQAGLRHVPAIIMGEPPAPRDLVQMGRSGIVVDAIAPPLDDQDLLASADHALAIVERTGDPSRVRSLREAQYGLTHREAEVLDLIVSGESNKEAARLLGISPRTIEVHRARVMTKLAVRNTADLVYKVISWRAAELSLAGVH